MNPGVAPRPRTEPATESARYLELPRSRSMTAMQAPSLNGRAKKTPLAPARPARRDPRRLRRGPAGRRERSRGRRRPRRARGPGSPNGPLQAEIVPLMLPSAVVAPSPVARPSRWARSRTKVASVARSLRAGGHRRRNGRRPDGPRGRCGLGDPLIATLVGGAAVRLLTAATVNTAPLWRPWLGMMDGCATVDGGAVRRKVSRRATQCRTPVVSVGLRGPNAQSGLWPPIGHWPGVRPAMAPTRAARTSRTGAKWLRSTAPNCSRSRWRCVYATLASRPGEWPSRYFR